MLRAAIVGNPNCGKTTLFNQLTGSRQKVGNWPGVTVDKKSGHFSHQGVDIELVDLPGVYSLTITSEESSIDERIAVQHILAKQADVYINIIDAANLTRNLYLTVQLLEMGVPCIIALNMLDIAKQRNIHIDIKHLSKSLGCPIVTLVSNKAQGIVQLKQQLINFDHKNYQPKQLISYPMAITKSIETLVAQLPQGTPQPNWTALKLLECDSLMQQHYHQPAIKQAVNGCLQEIENSLDEDSDIIIADARYQFIIQQVTTVTQSQKSTKRTFTQVLDSLFMNRYLGIPLFLLIMYLMFELSMNIGTLLQPLFDISSTTIFINGINYLGQQWHLPLWLTAIFSQGIGLGINTVLNFVPQIGLLFLFLSFLEDSGYMARAAFVMDRFMQLVGLPGKSFVPLIVGFGCNVPSIMATRTLDSRRDRILTAMMSPFMSCGARLAIFIVFAGAFFPEHGGFMVFLLYIIGIMVAIFTGLIMKKTLLTGEGSPFVLELPVYHWPHPRNILLMTWTRLKFFLIRAGKVIIPICVLVGSLNAISIDGSVHPDGSQHSLLSTVGRDLSPIFHPIGIQNDNWPATVGLITGTLAKEVVVGTLNTLYTQQDQNVASSLQNYHFWGGLKDAVTQTLMGLKQVFSSNMINPFTANEADHTMSLTAMGRMSQAFTSQWAAFAYLLFVLLYIPCISTIGALAREIGKGWAWFSTLWSFNVAYVLSLLFYQSTSFTLHPINSLSWISAALLSQLLLVTGLRVWSRQGVSQ